jgi:hypothetical protein
MFRHLGGCLAAVAALVAASTASHAQPPHPNPPPPPPPRPTVFARDWNSDILALAISGLDGGHARVAAGSRMFGICWSGGAGPYDIVLTDGSGQVVIHEAEVDPKLSAYIQSSPRVNLQPGFYRIQVTDHSAAHASAPFEVVEPSMLPAAAALKAGYDESAVLRARALSQADVTLSYEAFLRALPLANIAPKSDAASFVAELCHRSPQ